MNKENFDEIVEEFKKLYALKLKAQADPNYSLEKVLELLELGIEHDRITYYNFIRTIIPKLDSMNINWCKKYHDDVEFLRVNHPTEGAKFPEIFVDFKDYVDLLMNEKYIECQEIKDKIFTSY